MTEARIHIFDRHVRLDTVPDDLHEQVLGLAPWLAFGRNYRREIADSVAVALRMFRNGRNDEGRHWIEQAVNAAAPEAAVRKAS